MTAMRRHQRVDGSAPTSVDCRQSTIYHNGDRLMSFSYRRTYRGPIEAVLLDWAGTTMDFGCMAPAVVFVEVFERRKVPITMDEARAPMGAHKKVHIQKI